MFLLFALLTACDCAASFDIEWPLEGSAACRELDDPGACCPDGWEYAGFDHNNVVCVADVCADVVVLTASDEAPYCDSDGACCPKGYEPVGYREPTALVCVGG